MEAQSDFFKKKAASLRMLGIFPACCVQRTASCAAAVSFMAGQDSMQSLAALFPSVLLSYLNIREV